MNLTEQLLHALKRHGARQIFGIPGDFALPCFRIIEESQILPRYTLSHEPGVGFAADASARINGSLGVAAVTHGAGALNMINPVAAAFAEKSPVLMAAVVNRMLERVPGPDKAFSDTLQLFPAGLPEDGQSITPTDIATAVTDLMAAPGKMPMAADMGDGHAWQISVD